MPAVTSVPASSALAFCHSSAERGAPPASRPSTTAPGRLTGYESPIDERKGFDSRKNQLSETAFSRFLNLLDLTLSLLVDLDPAKGGKPKKSGKENKHRIVIKQTNTVGFQVLASYLRGKCDFDSLLESINFFDHCGLVTDPNTTNLVLLLSPEKQVVANSQNSSSKSNRSWQPR
ncbi:Protein argonaute [Elasticomyces elasticus]|nr:Protein argonaute [Elasticomyces elasticus]